MFQPKRTKYRKQQKGRNTGNAQRGATLSFGTFGLKATQRGQLTSRQIEAARRAMTRHVKRGAKIWIRVFPDKPITKKPLEVRQGKGKGNVEYWVCPIKPGKILYEMEGVDEELAKENIKVDVNGTGVVTLSIENVDSDTDEFAGTFVAIQPSDTDMGSKEPLDVKIIGELYGRKA